MKWLAAVDRIEGASAVVIPRGRPGTQFSIPRNLLPADIHDGTILRFSIDLDAESGRIRRKEIEAIQEDLERSSRKQGR